MSILVGIKMVHGRLQSNNIRTARRHERFNNNIDVSLPLDLFSGGGRVVPVHGSFRSCPDMHRISDYIDGDSRRVVAAKVHA